MADDDQKPPTSSFPRSLNQRNARLIQNLTTPKSQTPNSYATMPSNPHHKPAPEEKKVRVEGRRRLCRISSAEEEEGCIDRRCDEEVLIMDDNVESPISPASEIKDILKDLSSKFDTMKIDKKQKKKEEEEERSSSALAVVDLISPSPVEENPNVQNTKNAFPVQALAKKLEEAEYESAASSLSSFSVSGKDSDSSAESSSCNIVKEISRRPVVEGSRIDRCQIDDEEEEPSERPYIDSGSDLVVLDDDAEHEDGDTIKLTSKKGTFVLRGKAAKMLYPHQREGLNWLWEIHCKLGGGILGDDMGLGKTMQISAFLAGLFASRLINRALIVSPKTLIGHWIKELSIVGLSEKTRDYSGSSSTSRHYELRHVLKVGGILLTTYDIVRNNVKALNGDPCSAEDDNTTWDYVILDEGHAIKNPSTQRAQSLNQIPSAHRVIISGTPIQNNLKELWALFYFCCPNVLGDKKEFRDKYENPILRGNDKNATAREKCIGSQVAKDLRERIKPFFLRRLKSEVFHGNLSTMAAKLSMKQEIVVWLKLTDCQRTLYEAFLKSETVNSSVDRSPLAAITVLKKICDHPLLLTKRATEDILEGMDTFLNVPDHANNTALIDQVVRDITNSPSFHEQAENVSCKIKFLISLLENLLAEDHSVLIFSQSRKMLDIIQDAITLEGYRFLRIDGTTKAPDRQKLVNDFQEGNAPPIFLLTSQVGGLGLTLTRADRVIVVDPAWNPSTDNQSVDRAYRIGQQKDVLVYRLMTCGTIEEKIYRMQVFKGGLFKTATEHKEQTRYFSQKDIQELFQIPETGFDVSLTAEQLNEEHASSSALDGSFKDHLDFLQSQNIGGISHHNLLFSKSAPESINKEDITGSRPVYWKPASSKYAYSTCSEDYPTSKFDAVNPKDWKPKASGAMGNKDLQESDIRERIRRLRQTLENKALVAKLPDKGENIRKKVFELEFELKSILTCKTEPDSSLIPTEESEVIEVDDISEVLQKLSVSKTPMTQLK